VFAGQRACDFERGGSYIERNAITVNDHFCGLAADRTLRFKVPRRAELVGRFVTATETADGATVDATQETLAIQIAQITPDCHLGYGKAFAQVRDGQALALLNELDDLSAPLGLKHSSCQE
jgi:hypothetical protein